MSDAVRARDRGLSFVARFNRWMIAAAVAVAAGLSAFTAHAFHAKAASASSSGSAGASASSGAAPTSAPSTNPSGGIQPPASVPAQPAPVSVAPVSSGGS